MLPHTSAADQFCNICREAFHTLQNTAFINSITLHKQYVVELHESWLILEQDRREYQYADLTQLDFLFSEAEIEMNASV